MNPPRFAADQSLYTARGGYRSGGSSASSQNAVVPAIPNSRNCDCILDQREKHGWGPSALCNACLSGDCYNDPPMPNPYPTSIDWPSGF